MADRYGSGHSKGSSSSGGSDSTIPEGTRYGRAHPDRGEGTAPADSGAGINEGTGTGPAYSGPTEETGDYAPDPVRVDTPTSITGVTGVERRALAGAGVELPEVGVIVPDRARGGSAGVPARSGVDSPAVDVPDIPAGARTSAPRTDPGDVGDGIGDAVGDAVGDIGEWAYDAVDDTVGVPDGVEDRAADAVDRVTDARNAATDAFETVVDPIADHVPEPSGADVGDGYGGETSDLGTTGGDTGSLPEVDVRTPGSARDTYGGDGTVQDVQDVLTGGVVDVGDTTVPVGTQPIADALGERYEVGGAASRYVDEEEIDTSAPDDAVEATARTFAEGASTELAAAPATAVQGAAALGIEATQAGDYIVRGEDGTLDAGDFGEATGYERGAFADQFVDDGRARVGTPTSASDVTGVERRALAGADRERGRAEEVADRVGATAAATAAYAADNPASVGGSVVGGGVWAGPASVATGSAITGVARTARGRVRTAGGTRVDPEGLTNPETVDFYRGRSADGADARFPGAEDPDLYQSDPAAAVRQQADDYTPEAIRERFEEAGVEGTTLKKTLDVEPEGPDSGRSAQGFESAPGESLEDFDYETPGSFVGPELSPNFLGLGGDATTTSLSPGIPDLGDAPTGIVARTDVENPRASTLDEFNQEMIDRSGETTAVTKPAGEVNPGEVEAVIPPGAAFDDLGGGAVRNTLRDLGIGSDFYTELGGERVPLRPVRPADADADVDAPARAPDADADADGPTPAFENRPVESIVERPSPTVERPVPSPFGSPFGSGAVSDPSSRRPGRVDDRDGAASGRSDRSRTADPRDPPASGGADGGSGRSRGGGDDSRPPFGGGGSGLGGGSSDPSSPVDDPVDVSDPWPGGRDDRSVPETSDPSDPFSPVDDPVDVSDPWLGGRDDRSVPETPDRQRDPFPDPDRQRDPYPDPPTERDDRRRRDRDLGGDDGDDPVLPGLTAAGRDFGSGIASAEDILGDGDARDDLFRL